MGINLPVKEIRVSIPLKGVAMWFWRWLNRPPTNSFARSGVLAQLRFKEPRDDLEKVNALDFRMRWILRLAQMWAAFHGRSYIRVTDIDTPGCHLARGPHYRKQAIDLGIDPLSLKLWELFGDWINGFFDYGRGFKVVVVGRHDSKGKHDNHAHIQAPPPFMQSGVVPLHRAGSSHAPKQQ